MSRPPTPPFGVDGCGPEKPPYALEGAIIVGEGVPSKDREAAHGRDWVARLGSVSVDWWATVVAGVIVALAVANVLPRIPW
jgi:hypothetical protein